MTNDDHRFDVNRRELMKNTTALGVSAFGLGSLTTGSAAAEDREFAVTETTRLEGSAADAELKNAQRSGQVKKLIQGIENDANLSAELDAPFVLSVETDDEQVNAADPSVVFLPMSNAGAKGEAAGVLVTVVANASPESSQSARKPVMAFGMASERSGRAVGTASAGVSLKSYAYDEESGVETVNRETVSPHSPTSDDVSKNDLIGCAICIPLVTQLCDQSTGTIGKMVCVKACTPFLASSPLGYAACAASCSLIVDAINNYGCAAGASAICKAADLC